VSAFLSAYGLFLAELLTLVALVIVIVLLVASNRRGGHGSGLRVEHMNRRFEDAADALNVAMAGKRGKKEAKARTKERKREEKARAKEDSRRPRLFVLDF
jgi:serine protease SohB